MNPESDRFEILIDSVQFCARGGSGCAGLHGSTLRSQCGFEFGGSAPVPREARFERFLKSLLEGHVESANDSRRQ